MGILSAAACYMCTFNFFFFNFLTVLQCSASLSGFSSGYFILISVYWMLRLTLLFWSAQRHRAWMSSYISAICWGFFSIRIRIQLRFEGSQCMCGGESKQIKESLVHLHTQSPELLLFPVTAVLTADQTQMSFQHCCSCLMSEDALKE